MDDPPENTTTDAGGISQLDDDLLQNILEKLPAKSFASAACVSRSWNGTCSRILSHPKLCSAFSLNPSLPDAMNQVVGKVLLGPIQPHFAILCVCPSIDLDEAHRLITAKLGSSIPIITCTTAGIIGRDALTDRVAEVKFPYSDVEDLIDHPKGCGISFTIGYVPGLKVDTIPLPCPEEGEGIDKFVVDISDYSASVSGCKSPEAIIMFADSQGDMKPVLQKMNCAFSKQTVIAGNEGCSFRYGSTSKPSITSTCPERLGLADEAVALVFVRDRSKLNGLGEIEFHFSVGTGVTAMGPTYKVASAKMRSREFATWLTARRQGENETLDGQQMLADIDMEMFDSDLYIGVTKRRKCSIGSEKVKCVTSLVYHPVQDADEEYLYVCGLDVKTGDTFRFYVPDPELALPSSETASQEIAQLKHKEIIGGFIFTCCGRGAPFFGRPNIDSSPVLDNFPSIPVSGMFCGGEIGRGPSISGQSDGGQEQSFLHVYSSVYLLLSFTPPPRRA